MTTKEFYTLIHGNYDEVVSRLLTEARVQKYVIRFLDDKSLETLEQSMNNRDAELAFRMAHTLKGIALNLGFNTLRISSSELCELLRDTSEITEEAFRIYRILENDYHTIVNAIHQIEGESF